MAKFWECDAQQTHEVLSHLTPHWGCEQLSLHASRIREALCRLLLFQLIKLWASINGWWKSSCSSASLPIKPQCLHRHHRESEWEIWVAPPFYSDACQGLLTCWVQSDVKRLYSCMGIVHNAAFHHLHPVTSPVLGPVERWGGITGWIGRERGKDRWGVRERRKGQEGKKRKIDASCSLNHVILITMPVSCIKPHKNHLLWHLYSVYDLFHFLLAKRKH